MQTSRFKPVLRLKNSISSVHGTKSKGHISLFVLILSGMMTLTAMGQLRFLQLHIKASVPVLQTLNHHTILRDGPALIHQAGLSHEGDLAIDGFNLKYRSKSDQLGSNQLERITVQITDEPDWPESTSLWFRSNTSQIFIHGINQR